MVHNSDGTDFSGLKSNGVCITVDRIVSKDPTQMLSRSFPSAQHV